MDFPQSGNEKRKQTQVSQRRWILELTSLFLQFQDCYFQAGADLFAGGNLAQCAVFAFGVLAFGMTIGRLKTDDIFPLPHLFPLDKIRQFGGTVFEFKGQLQYWIFQCHTSKTATAGSDFMVKYLFRITGLWRFDLMSVLNAELGSAFIEKIIQ